MRLTLDELFNSPDHYLHSFEDGVAIFVPMDRAAYHRSIFLDRRIVPAAPGSMRVPVTMLAGHEVGKLAPVRWIFHVAHCGSTLLARALDDVVANLVLREPLALRQIALAPDPARVRIVTSMVSKRYRASLPTVVKANVPVNFLLPQIVEQDASARAIFLYFSLQDYVLAILRDDRHRTWLRNVTAQLKDHVGDVATLSDAERVAALWVAQMRAFAAAIAVLPNARSLNAETFFQQPRDVLAAAVAHFEMPMSQADIDRKVGGPLFNTYSKNPSVDFDNDERLARRSLLEKTLAGEQDRAHAWVERVPWDRHAVTGVVAAAELLR
jgi:hypothetical protein